MRSVLRLASRAKRRLGSRLRQQRRYKAEVLDEGIEVTVAEQQRIAALIRAASSA